MPSEGIDQGSNPCLSTKFCAPVVAKDADRATNAGYVGSSPTRSTSFSCIGMWANGKLSPC